MHLVSKKLHLVLISDLTTTLYNYFLSNNNCILMRQIKIKAFSLKYGMILLKIYNYFFITFYIQTFHMWVFNSNVNLIVTIMVII